MEHFVYNHYSLKWSFSSCIISDTVRLRELCWQYRCMVKITKKKCFFIILKDLILDIINSKSITSNIILSLRIIGLSEKFPLSFLCVVPWKLALLAVLFSFELFYLSAAHTAPCTSAIVINNVELIQFYDEMKASESTTNYAVTLHKSPCYRYMVIFTISSPKPPTASLYSQYLADISKISDFFILNSVSESS